MASKRRCRMTICSRSVRRTMSIGSTSAARSGRFSTSSLIRASNFTFPTMPTLRPKLRKVPRRSFSIAIAFDCSSLRCVSSIRSFLTAYRLHMHRTVKPSPHHLRNTARIVAVRLVDLRLQHRLHVPRLNADHRQSCIGESAEQPLRQRSSFQPNSLEVVGGVLQHRQQRFRFARHLYFPNDLACVIHNADARLLDRNVQSRKMVHAALLLLMLEAAFTDLVSPSA